MRLSAWSDSSHIRRVSRPFQAIPERALKICYQSHQVTLQCRRQVSTLRPWTNDESNRIYIQGTGNQGRFIAHSLSKLPDRPPMTFIVSSNRRAAQFADNQGKVEVIKEGVSSMSDGYHIEVFVKTGGGTGTTKAVAPGAKHFMLKTLHARSGEVEAEIISKRKTKRQKRSRRFPKDRSGAMSLNYLSKRKMSKPARRRSITASDLKPTEPETVLQDSHPIKNLILTTRANFVVELLHNLKHRLRRGSTILFLQRGMGYLEKVNEEVFPDPKTRPNYLIGITSLPLWMRPRALSGGEPSRETPGSSEHEDTWVTYTSDIGSLVVGPVAYGHETPGRKIKRQKETSYLLGNILAAEDLYPRLADREDLLFMRSRKVAVESVTHPMSALLECCNADILKDDTRRAIARGLLEEAHRVVSRDVPRITYEALEEMLGEHVTKTATNFSPMMNAVMGGRESDIDWINGWIVRRARELGIECPKNEQVIRLIKDKIEAQAILWQERAQAIVATKRELQIEARKYNRHVRYEKIRKEKEVKSRVKLAKAKAMRQEKMPDFHKPQIKTLGNVPIRRVEVSSKMPDFHKPQIEKLGNVTFRRLENSS